MKFFGLHTMILNESIKLLLRNKKPMAFITMFSLFLSSTLFLLLKYSIKSMIMDMSDNILKSFMPDPSSFNLSDPSSFNMSDPSSFTPKTGFGPYQMTSLFREYFALLLAVEILLLFGFSTIAFFSSISTILVSSMSYTANNLSLKELASLIQRTWTRPLITTLYVSGLAISYSTIVLTLIAPLLLYRSLATFVVAILLGAIGFNFYLYLVVAWALAIVVSVVEDHCYGLDALGKAATLVRGMKLHGFLINIYFNVAVLIIFQGYLMTLGLANLTSCGLFVVNVSCLAKILLHVAYTVLYFRCKLQNGEEIKLPRNVTVQYTELLP